MSIFKDGLVTELDRRTVLRFVVTYRRGMLYSSRHLQSYLLHPNRSL